MSKNIDGFSKLSKEEKISWISQYHFSDPEDAKKAGLVFKGLGRGQ